MFRFRRAVRRLCAASSRLLLIACISISAALPSGPGVAAAAPVTVRVDGRLVPADPAPFIAGGRTLIPLRAVFEALGATVEWHEATRTVSAQRGGRYVRLQVDNRVACLDAACTSAELLDVPAQIRQNRTFVPLRFVASALGAGVHWDAASRTVQIESTPDAPPDTAPAVRITAPAPGQVISGPAGVQAWLAPEVSGQAAEIRFFLLDPQRGRGPIIARGSDPAAAYTWLPDPAYDGQRLLAAAVYDGQGRFLAGDVIPVRVAVSPQVVLRGPAPGQRVDGPVALAVDVNFVATHVRYEKVDPATGQTTTLAEADPYAGYTWSPAPADNGRVTLRAVALDRLGRAHASQTVEVEVAVPPRLSLGGVSAGRTVERPITLSAYANFPVTEVRYLLRDPATGSETLLATKAGGGTLRWVPTPAHNGARQLLVEVVDGAGQVRRSDPVPVQVKVAPAVFVETVGPNQVLTGKVDLRAVSSVPLQAIEYQLVDARGQARRIAGGSDPTATYSWTPAAGDAGSWRLRAVGTRADGSRVTSEDIPVRVYTGKIYGPHVAVPKDQFLDVAGRLGIESHRRTGMSAALQVAQAILESGWGQYAPADKYTGQRSYNLFGIKGKGPAGSVTSNTWEEYHGVVYRVDAAFRAYRSVEESWQDHKRLLLEAARYAPFREVMHDPVRGAWALRRAGYATDSQYPLKLIRLMQQHDLFRLDETTP